MQILPRPVQCIHSSLQHAQHFEHTTLRHRGAFEALYDDSMIINDYSRSTCSLRDLYKQLRGCVLDVRRVKPDRPVCLVMDDLSVLVSVGVRLVEVVGLAHYCQHMLTYPQKVSLSTSSLKIVCLANLQNGKFMIFCKHNLQVHNVILQKVKINFFLQNCTFIVGQIAS